MGTLAGHDHGRQRNAGRRGRLLLARGAALCESRLRGKTANPATAAKRGLGGTWRCVCNAGKPCRPKRSADAPPSPRLRWTAGAAATGVNSPVGGGNAKACSAAKRGKAQPDRGKTRTVRGSSTGLRGKTRIERGRNETKGRTSSLKSVDRGKTRRIGAAVGAVGKRPSLKRGGCELRRTRPWAGNLDSRHFAPDPAPSLPEDKSSQQQCSEARS